MTLIDPVRTWISSPIVVASGAGDERCGHQSSVNGDASSYLARLGDFEWTNVGKMWV